MKQNEMLQTLKATLEHMTAQQANHWKYSKAS